MLDKNGELIEINTINESTVMVDGEAANQAEVDILDVSVETDIQYTSDTIAVSEVNVAVVESQSAFAPIGEPNELRRHSLLTDRDLPNQHPITSIEGLREELDEIEALGTVYSDKRRHAEYYLWNDGNKKNETRIRLFVSICEDTNQIKVCSTDDEIFGVTVTDAAFIGAEANPKFNEIPRDNTYGLAVCVGAVPVLCEPDVVIGDYVVSNGEGKAKKSNVAFGLKVVAMTKIDGVEHAVVVLGVSASQVNVMGEKLQGFDARLTADEANITSAINVANAAYLKANGIDSSNTSILDRVNDALEDTKEAISKVESYESNLQNVATIATQAKKAAECAESLANNTVSDMINVMSDIDELTEDIVEADTKAGYALSAIIRDEQSMQSLVFGVLDHNYGEFSQSYNLNAEQAANILEQGQIYVPSVSHKETMNENPYDFTRGYYYTWDGTKWLESDLPYVAFSIEEIVGNYTSLLYWVPTDDVMDKENTEEVKYMKDTLYKWEDDQWVPKAALQGNALCRSATSIKQTLTEVSIDVTNVKGDVASIITKVDENSSSIQGIVTWKGDTGESLATYLQEAGKDYAKTSQIAQITNDDGTVTAASIVAAVNGQTGESIVHIDADYINFDGFSTFVRADKAEAGTTIINGACITTGVIQSDGYTPPSGDSVYATYGTSFDLDAGSFVSEAFTIQDGKAYFKAGATLGILQSDNYSPPTDSVYSGAGTQINLTEGTIITPGFSVNAEGKASFKGGVEVGSYIGKNGTRGWKIDENSLYHGETFKDASIWLCAEGSNATKKIGTSKDDANGWVIQAGGNFGVTKNGILYCSGAELDKDCKIYGTLYGDTICSHTNTSDSIEASINFKRSSDALTSEEYGVYEMSINNNTVTNLGAKLRLGMMPDGYSHIALECFSPSNAINGIHMYQGAIEIKTNTFDVTSTTIYLNGTVYTTSGTVNKSDRNSKNSIMDINSQYETLFDALRPVCYKFNDGTSDRYHTGFIAQEVDEAITNAGLTRQDFAALCISEGGTESERWGLRYEEFIALNTHEIQRLKARIAELEAKLG